MLLLMMTRRTKKEDDMYSGDDNTAADNDEEKLACDAAPAKYIYLLGTRTTFICEHAVYVKNLKD